MTSPAGLKGVALLGATGSIGETAQRVIARHPDRFCITAMTANGSVEGLRRGVELWNPSFAALASPAPGEPLPDGWRVGSEALVEAVGREDVDIVLNAVVGAAGLEATLSAISHGKRVALANKESLVVGGEIVKAAVAKHRGQVVPVDSEHSALLQCLCGRIDTAGDGLFPLKGVKRLLITASGGPFREWSQEQIAGATLADVLKHPTWNMGRKITVDSASLANKALEVIEAHVLFGVPYDRIEVVVHPQSIVHSMVEFEDGSVLAQMGVPSMELPILYALSYPERFADDGIPGFDPVAAGTLTFESVRRDVFPALELGIEAGRRGGAAPAVFNAANEAAVARVLDGSLMFSKIPNVIEIALNKLGQFSGDDLESLFAADSAARSIVQEFR